MQVQSAKPKKPPTIEEFLGLGRDATLMELLRFFLEEKEASLMAKAQTQDGLNRRSAQPGAT
jgi:hypothetical protein